MCLFWANLSQFYFILHFSKLKKWPSLSPLSFSTFPFEIQCSMNIPFNLPFRSLQQQQWVVKKERNGFYNNSSFALEKFCHSNANFVFLRSQKNQNMIYLTSSSYLLPLLPLRQQRVNGFPFKGAQATSGRGFLQSLLGMHLPR